MRAERAVRTVRAVRRGRAVLAPPPAAAATGDCAGGPGSDPGRSGASGVARHGGKQARTQRQLLTQDKSSAARTRPAQLEMRENRI